MQFPANGSVNSFDNKRSKCLSLGIDGQDRVRFTLFRMTHIFLAFKTTKLYLGTVIERKLPFFEILKSLAKPWHDSRNSGRSRGAFPFPWGASPSRTVPRHRVRNSGHGGISRILAAEKTPQREVMGEEAPFGFYGPATEVYQLEQQRVNPKSKIVNPASHRYLPPQN